MFEEPRQETPHHKKLSLPGKKMALVYGIIILCLGIILVLLIAIRRANSSAITIPPAITENTKHPIYLPKKLPGNYQIIPSSFSLVEDNTVLIFEAEDGAGVKLIFSEQARSKNFNFEEFYKEQIRDTKILNDVPYPSVWGKSIDGRTTLSIVTDDVWILMVTSGPLDEKSLRLIAAEMQQ